MLFSNAVAPRFSELPRDLEVTANGRIALECVAEGIPTPLISWKINNTDFHRLYSIQLPSCRLLASHNTLCCSMPAKGWIKCSILIIDIIAHVKSMQFKKCHIQVQIMC